MVLHVSTLLAVINATVRLVTLALDVSQRPTCAQHLDSPAVTTAFAQAHQTEIYTAYVGTASLEVDARST